MGVSATTHPRGHLFQTRCKAAKSFGQLERLGLKAKTDQCHIMPSVWKSYLRAYQFRYWPVDNSRISWLVMYYLESFRYRIRDSAISILSLIIPKAMLQLEHNKPRTLPVSWQWSTAIRFFGCLVLHIAQQYPWACAISSHCLRVMPYLDMALGIGAVLCHSDNMSLWESKIALNRLFFNEFKCELYHISISLC